MIYSGADLIRKAGVQNERAERLRVVAPSATTEAAAPAQTNLQQDGQSALLRFAHFIHGQKKKPKRPLPAAYLNADDLEPEGRGVLLNVYV